jgi:hypothetical protein
MNPPAFPPDPVIEEDKRRLDESMLVREIVR